MAAARVPGDSMAEGFLGRWAQRKADARKGLPLADPVPTPVPAASPVTATAVPARPVEPAPGAPSSIISRESTLQAPQSEPETLPTMQDVQALTRDSDFKPFVARGVTPEVRNAAMKKLFADPHYNVMDRLDIYIDDYSQPDPIPASMLRKMASAQLLKLFEEKEHPGSRPSPVEDNSQAAVPLPTPSQDVAPSTPVTAPAAHEVSDHDDTDLRLQPDHAAQAPGSGRGTE